jgi:FlaG/FlaF family flagellin (archaellin)
MDQNVSVNASLSLTASGTLPNRPAADAPTTQRTADGKVRFENDNYRITAGDDNQVLIQNKDTGEQYRIWGDPHVEIDGKQAFDFWGQTTFMLDDGTKVTIETTPWDEGGNGATIASKVTITDGAYTTEIRGVDTNTKGDLGFREFHGVAATLQELATRDGNVLYENENGAGFIALDRDGNMTGVDQAFINATDEIKNGGLSFMQGYREMLHVFRSLVGIVFSGDLVSHENDAPGPDVLPAPQQLQNPTTDAPLADAGDAWSFSWSFEFNFSMTRPAWA